MRGDRPPFFKPYPSLRPAALWLAEDGRHYSGSPIDKDGYRPDMDRLREYFSPGRRLFVCAWGAWAHGMPCTVARDATQSRDGHKWPGWEKISGPVREFSSQNGVFRVDIMVIIQGEDWPRPCEFQHLTPFQPRGGTK